VSSIKERAELTIIGELAVDPVLKALCPKKQNSDGKPRTPSIAVTATVGKEYEVGSGIFRIAATVEFRFDVKKDGGSGDALDNAVSKARELLAAAQGRGEYGLIFEGEGQSFTGDTLRVRTLNLTLIGA
jgi:hypothetical protein